MTGDSIPLVCNACASFTGTEGAPVGPCLRHGFLVVAQYDGPRCFFHSGAAVAAADAGASARSEARTGAPRSGAAFPPATNRGGKVQSGQVEKSILRFKASQLNSRFSSFKGRA